MISNTPSPPYYAVIFTSLRTLVDEDYASISERMATMAAQQDGYLGMESARDGLGLTVSYWRDLESIRNWKKQVDHMHAQELGRSQWYAAYKVRIAKVERDYDFSENQLS